MAPTLHATLGASNSHRWLECPGSVALCKDVPRTTTVYSEEGTAAHKLCEWCLTTPCNAADKIGKTVLKSSFPDDPPKIVNGFWVVTKEMAEAVQVYVDHINSSYQAMPGAKVVVEQKFALNWLMPGDVLWGTNDCGIIQPFGSLRVNDYKHGVGVAVDAENNSQLKYYGLGALGKDNPNSIEDVYIDVIQPRNFIGDPVKTWRTTPDELYQWGYDVLLPGAKLALTEGAPLKPGDHCKFCPALKTCPAVAQKALETAGAPFQSLATIEPSAISLRSPATLTIAELEKVVAVSDMIGDWAKASAAELELRLERGEVSQHFKIVAGKSSRKWTDETLAIDALKQYIEPFEMSMLTPKGAEDKMKEANIDKKTREAVVASLVTKTAGRSIAPIGDKRPALLPAGMPFGVIETTGEPVFDV